MYVGVQLMRDKGCERWLVEQSVVEDVPAEERQGRLYVRSFVAMAIEATGGAVGVQGRRTPIATGHHHRHGGPDTPLLAPAVLHAACPHVSRPTRDAAPPQDNKPDSVYVLVTVGPRWKSEKADGNADTNGEARRGVLFLVGRQS